MSLSTQTLDLFDDLGYAQLKEIVPNAPSFVKTANFAPREEVSKLPTDAFALHALTKEGSRLRRFPIHTAADTWLSAAYFEKNAHKLPRQAARIAATHLKVACEKFSVPTNLTVESFASDENPVSNLYVEEADFSKTASARPVESRPQEGQYALPGRYPLFNENFVKKASAYFVDYFGQFDPADRHAYARNVLNRGAELNVSFDTEEYRLLSKVAGAEYGDRLDHQLKLRREFTEHIPGAVEKLNKIASVMGGAGPQQFAQLLDKWDQETGMARNYGRYLLDAYQATFDRQFEKEASYTWADTSSGVEINDRELVKAASEKYDTIKGYLGVTLADSLKKHGHQIFDSLPVDAKILIARIAKGDV